MNKMAWFDQYESLYDQREAGEIDEDTTDEELTELATEKVEDLLADRADQINDERWERKRAGE